MYLNKGYNTDGKAWSAPASVEGLEGLETDSSTTLYDAIVECRVIKSKKEIDIMQHITNLSSEAHFEVCFAYNTPCQIATSFFRIEG